MSLEAKQKYYEYGSSYYYRKPPRLDGWARQALREIDPDYRLIFGGVAVIRKDPRDERPYIRGDERATKVNAGRIVPTYLHIKVAQPEVWCYRHKKGHVVRVNREDQVPKGKLSWCEARHIEFGRLRWFLERHWPSEQLVAAGIYHQQDVTLPRGGEWRWCLTIETPEPESLYYEPTREWMEMVREHVYEMNNVPLSELYLMDGEAREQRKKLKKEGERRELDNFLSRHFPGYTPPEAQFVLTR